MTDHGLCVGRQLSSYYNSIDSCISLAYFTKNLVFVAGGRILGLLQSLHSRWYYIDGGFAICS